MRFVHLRIINNVYENYSKQLVNHRVFYELLDEHMLIKYAQLDPRPLKISNRLFYECIIQSSTYNFHSFDSHLPYWHESLNHSIYSHFTRRTHKKMKVNIRMYIRETE